MQNKHDDQILDNLAELSDTEIEELLGAGHGVKYTWTHECHMNSIQFLFTCCWGRQVAGGTPRPLHT